MYCLQRFERIQTCEHFLRVTAPKNGEKPQTIDFIGKRILRWEKKLSPKDASFIKHTVKLTFLPFMNQCLSVRCTICNSLCFC